MVSQGKKRESKSDHHNLNNGNQEVKKSKKIKVPDEELISICWSHYRAYLDSENEVEEEVGDFDELHELIDLLKEYVQDQNCSRTTLGRQGKTSSEEVQKKYTSIQTLLPVLMSMVYLHLGIHAISQSLEEIEEADDNTDTAENYLQMSLRYYPFNASTLSMLANYKRMNLLDHPRDICRLYELASHNAGSIRNGALMILENKDDDDDDDNERSYNFKEWIELLFLDGMSGVEYIGNDGEDSNHQGEDESVNIDGNRGKTNSDENQEDDEENEEEFSMSQVEATSSFMAALLNSTLGDHDRALQYLLKFNISHRIHPKLWSFASTKIDREPISDENHSNDKIIFQPTIFKSIDGIIPSSTIFERMRKTFSPSAPYWTESNYKNRGYYSFFQDLTPVMKSHPKTIIEDLIVNHLLPLVKTKVSQDQFDQIVGFEWWVHTRPVQANLGHQIHFDTDEALLSQENKITHPLISSVLYLSGNQRVVGDQTQEYPAGATIVFDQSPDSKQVASRAWISHAEDNCYMIFPGDRLHGVLPCRGLESNGEKKIPNLKDGISSKKDDDNIVERCTFMVGFWTRRVPDGLKERNLYGPCGFIPEDSEEHTWVKEISMGYSDESASDTKATSRDNMEERVSRGEVKSDILPCVSPAWECIREKNTEEIDDKYLEIPKDLDHRFFVNNAPHCFRESLFKD